MENSFGSFYICYDMEYYFVEYLAVLVDRKLFLNKEFSNSVFPINLSFYNTIIIILIP